MNILDMVFVYSPLLLFAVGTPLLLLALGGRE